MEIYQWASWAVDEHIRCRAPQRSNRNRQQQSPVDGAGHFDSDTLCCECSENGETVQTTTLGYSTFLFWAFSPNVSLELSKVLSSLDCKKLKGKKWNIEED